MSSYPHYQQIISEDWILETAKRIGPNPTLSDREAMSQHYSGHQWIVSENPVVVCDRCNSSSHGTATTP
jgi:hypothetical protein